MGLPSSHSLHLMPCYGLRPRWTHITLQCPRTPCYIPRPEDWTNGGVNAAFRHTDNVGFQNHQNFGAYNLHLSIVAWYPIPPAPHSLLPVCMRGSVLRWWLAFPQAGFSPAGEYEFISARPCPLWLCFLLMPFMPAAVLCIRLTTTLKILFATD